MISEHELKETIKLLELIYIPLLKNNIKKTEQYLVYKFNIPYLYFFISPTSPNPTIIPYIEYDNGYHIDNKYIVFNNKEEKVNLRYRNSFRLDCYLDSINFYTNQFKSPLCLRFKIDKNSINKKFKIILIRRQIQYIEDGIKYREG